MPSTKISLLPSLSTALSGSELFPIVDTSGLNKKATITDIFNYFPAADSGHTGLLTDTDWTTFNNKQQALSFGNLSETGSSILTITGGTGSVIGSGTTIQVKQATGSQSGFLSSTDWNTFNSKGNGTVTSVDLITGTTGTDVNVSGSPITSSGSITLNIPDASATARGLITTGTQTLAGSKTFSSAPTFSTMTAGSVLFAGASGLLSQDNAGLYWDDTNNRLGIGTATPGQSLHLIGNYLQNHTVTTTSGAAGAQSVVLTIAPTVNSAAQHRAYNMSNQHNAAGINFSGLQTTAAWFENRVLNSGTHAELNGVISTGLLLATNSASCGTVTSAFGLVGFGVNQFNTNSLTTTITNAVSIFASDQGKNTCTITNACGVLIAAQTKGTNNTDLLVGTTTIPSGTWSIYASSASNNHINGKLFIGTTTDAGFKLDVNGTARVQDNLTISDAKNIIFGTSTGNKIGTATSQKIGFWNATPIVQPTTAVASATVVSPGAGSTIKTDDTFDGYTLQQVVKALRNTGILA